MLSVLEALGLILSTGKTKQESKLALLGFFFFFSLGACPAWWCSVQRVVIPEPLGYSTFSGPMCLEPPARGICVQPLEARPEQTS
jgi:apolipoprotein N-acyltransferase